MSFVENYHKNEQKLLKSGTIATLGGFLGSDLSSFTTVGTSEETAATYTLPANALELDGRGVRIRAWGTTAANGNNKTIKLKFGALVFTSGAVASNNKDWWMELEVYRTGSATQQSIGYGWLDAAIQPDYQAGTVDLTAAVTILCTLTTATAAAGATCEGFTVELI